MYRKELDGLRAIAIIAVILNHVKHGLCPSGYLGVDMFFVLSGFVITKSLLEKDKMGIFDFLKNFWARRAKRLFPALFLTTSVTILITLLFSSNESHHTTMSIETGLSSLIGLGNIYLASMATDYFSTTAELNAFTHTWSLGVEEQFYLLFPFLFWAFMNRAQNKKLFISILFLFTGLSLLFFLKNFEKNPIKSFYFVQSRFWELSLGSLVFLFSNQVERNNGSLKKIFSNVSLILLPILLSIILIFLFDSKYPSIKEKYYNLLIVLLTAFFLLFSESKSSVIKLLQWKPIAFIGLLSYSLYLWHWPVVTFFRWTFGIKSELIPLILLLCFFLSILSYKFVESPLRNSEWKWKFINQNGSFSPATLSIFFGICLIIFIRLILFPFYLDGMFYLGIPAKMKFKGVHNLLAPVSHNTETWNPIHCVLTENNDIGKNISSEKCSFGIEFKNKRKYLVLGNSFSAAQVYMFQTIADKGEMVTITSSWGGAPAPNLSRNGKWDKINDYYWEKIIPQLMNELKANDVIIMVFDLYDYIDSKELLSLLSNELSGFLSLCKQKQIKVIFQHAIPFMRESNCNPDLAQKQWWHEMNEPPCLYFSKTETLKRREPLNEKLVDLKQRHSNFFVMDLMDVFCPDEECRFIDKNGQYLYRDEFSHPSVEASILARPNLLKSLNDLN
ncbi:acyltransferase family protein [Leptospira terpstrae]|uniref:acyltransferase family protein n=1 Tax=Leptospira terpstrae TaxID=293075 RepID=UPI003D042454